MVKAMHGQGWVGGVLRGSVLSSLASYGAMRRCLAWLSIVRPCPAKLRDVRHGLTLQGLALYSTALSCPVRLCKALLCEVLLWYGGAGSGPAGSSGAWLTMLRRFLARLGMVSHCKVQSCLAGQGTALSWQGGVEQSEVRHGKLSLLPGEVLFCIVGFVGALYAKVRSYCGMVWSVEALHSIVKFCPVKYSVALHAKALFWLSGVLHGIAWRGSVGRCLVSHAKLLFRHGTVGSGFARLRAAGQALVSSRFGRALLSQVRRGSVLQGPVRLGLHRYGGIKNE